MTSALHFLHEDTQALDLHEYFEYYTTDLPTTMRKLSNNRKQHSKMKGILNLGLKIKNTHMAKVNESDWK